jgi:soluble lytic murein transglycosylase-like protein
MIRACWLAGALALSIGPAAHADDLTRGQPVAACLVAAAEAYHLPPAILMILLDVEGGSLGRVTANPNGSVDIGPMQVNDTWLAKLARHWQAPRPAVYAALRDQICANIEGGAWILRQAIDEAHGDLWNGVGIYHSHDPARKAAYLKRVARDALRRVGEHG